MLGATMPWERPGAEETLTNNVLVVVPQLLMAFAVITTSPGVEPKVMEGLAVMSVVAAAADGEKDQT